jgi:hypothetical protein
MGQRGTSMAHAIVTNKIVAISGPANNLVQSSSPSFFVRNWCAFCAGVLLFGAGLLPVRGADFEVINTEDSGFGSLRQAIEDANDNPGADGRTSIRRTPSNEGIHAGASDMRIEHNAIAFSRDGINVLDQRVLILTNSIYAHDRAGILHNSMIPTNDAADLDTDPNGLQNYPTLTAVLDGTEAAISGELPSKPDTAYIVQIFAGSGPTGPWLPLLDLPARRTNTVMTILDRHALSRRFYRLLTPSGF